MKKNHQFISNYMLVAFVALFVSSVAVAQVPTITSVSSQVGYPASSVTITGTNFNATPADNIVFFGATQATVSIASTTSLTVAVPFGATYAPVSVNNTVSHLTAYSKHPFLPTYNSTTNLPDMVNFAGKFDLDASNTAQGLAMGDLDGDGKADLAAVGYGTGILYTYRNISSTGSLTAGSFATRQEFITGNQPVSVAIADVDGDGKLDVLVNNSGDGSVAIFRNTSAINSISFAPKVTVPVSLGSWNIAMGDINGDGKADMALPVVINNKVSVYRNTSSIGTISFDPGVDFITGTRPSELAMGDLDGDGKTDMAVVNTRSRTTSVFRNMTSSGSVSFDTKVDLVAGTGPVGIAIGDLNGDGKADLAISNDTVNTVSVLLNNGSGSISFAAKTDFPADKGSVAIGDFDGNGKPDLVITNAAGVSVLRNTGNAGSISFATKVDYTTGNSSTGVAVGDLDGDGKADIAVTRFSGFGLSIIRNAPFSNVVYSKSTGLLNSLATWGSNPDGTGTAPLNFTTAGMTYNIVNNPSPTFTGSWAPVGTVNVGNGINAVNFTITEPSTYTGSAINVKAGATLTIVNVIPVLGTLSVGSTVAYTGNNGRWIASATYSNLTVISGKARGPFTVNGTLQVGTSAAPTGYLNMDVYQLLLHDTATVSNYGTISSACIDTLPIPANRTWGGILYYNGGDEQELVAGTYNTLSENGVGMKQTGNVVANTLDITSGIINTGTFSITTRYT